MACWFPYLEMFTGRVLTLRNCPFQFESAWFIYNTCIIIRQLAISFSVFFCILPQFRFATCYFVFRLLSILPRLGTCNMLFRFQALFVSSSYLFLFLFSCQNYLLQKMSRIYHGCFRKNADGTNRIIANNERCLMPCSKPFWKYIEDIPSGVKKRSQ